MNTQGREEAEERFVERLTREAREHYNRPPATPRDEMWAVIQAARTASGARLSGAQGAEADQPVEPPGERAPGAADATVVPMRRVASQRWWVAIAAALVIGVALGRLTLTGGDGEQVAVREAPTATGAPATGQAAALDGAPGAEADRAAPLPYRLAAAEHLARTETLLTTFRVDSRSARLDGELGMWAKELLTETRLLLDSPASRDPQIGRLLQDLELVLAQIVQLRPGDAEDAEIIGEGIDRRQLMLRLRTVSTPAAGSAGT